MPHTTCGFFLSSTQISSYLYSFFHAMLHLNEYATLLTMSVAIEVYNQPQIQIRHIKRIN
nr:MAG TPA: hypothetical protein [Caudoviricetes sp.]